MDENEQGIYGFPAAVRAIQPTNRESLLALARERANDPTILDEMEPFFWAAILSNNRLDAYFTRMARSSLDNFARGAAEGVSFQNSHRWDELPLGASLTGRVEGLESGIVQVVSDFYTLAGLELNGIRTDQFIRGVRSGVVRDVSIGFSGGSRTCEICHQNYWRCPHYAGMTYEIEENGVIRQVRATVTVENAKLNEASAVYDGATPGAVILKARAAAAEGRLRGKEAEQLERMYRAAIPVTRQFAGVDVEESEPHEEVRTMGLDAVLDKHKIGVGLEGDARAAALESRLAELIAAEGKLSVAQEELATAQGRVKELEPAAADGTQYRADLLADAMAEGVRAYGDKFDQATYEETLRTAKLDTIKRMRDDWKAVGDVRLPGGRHSQDGDERSTKTVTVHVPDEAYG
ncbi:MAG: hypothetical protein IT328_20115 [Caldilineaceae bacterium]|nr:hypothetical protein [Caldilineaceae bacterium]